MATTVWPVHRCSDAPRRRAHQRRYIDPVFAAMLPMVSLSLGCVALSRKPAVPEALQDPAVVMNATGVRTWGDRVSEEFLDEPKPIIARTVERWRAAGNTLDGYPWAEIPPGYAKEN